MIYIKRVCLQRKALYLQNNFESMLNAKKMNFNHFNNGHLIMFSFLGVSIKVLFNPNHIHYNALLFQCEGLVE